MSEQLERFKQAVGYYQKKLELDDWILYVDEADLAVGHHAEANILRINKEAWLRVNMLPLNCVPEVRVDVDGKPFVMMPETVEGAAVHELCHVLVDELWATIESLLRVMPKGAAAAELRTLADAACERVVFGLQNIVLKVCPFSLPNVATLVYTYPNNTQSATAQALPDNKEETCC